MMQTNSISTEPLVHLEQVAVAQDEHWIIQDVNLTVHPGEFVYLIGQTGSGKSSLLKALYGEIPLAAGTGHVCGHDLSQITRHNVYSLRRDLGMVFQDFALLPDRTAAENLAFVLSATGWSDQSAIDLRVQTCLDQVGLGTKGYKMPHALSGGEQQRVAIARALLNEPPLIVADEPTGNLDPETTEGILELLHELVRNDRSVIMATHDHAAFERHPGKVIRCAQGRVEILDALPV
jgi:cell division transport system ATP-binding protein